MRRFSDPILFLVLSIVTAVVWWIAAATNSYPEVPAGYLAPMTVVVFCVVATPALVTITLAALARALFNLEPRVFWAWVTGVGVVATGLTALANGITDQQAVQVGFSTTAWFSGVVAGAGLIALVLALTGAIPSGKSGVSNRNVVANDVALPSEPASAQTPDGADESAAEPVSVGTEVAGGDVAVEEDPWGTPPQSPRSS